MRPIFKLHTLLFACIISTNVNASTRTQDKDVDSLSAVVQAYADSIRILSERLDSLSAVNKKATDDGRYYRLFVPMTFYHSAADKSLMLTPKTGGMDAVVDAVDAALMKIYLKRPDLVTNSESRLKKAGTIRDDVEQPITQKIELTKKTEPLPDTPVLAPTQVVVKKPNFWTFGGESNVQFMQNFISSNWHKGGESNYSMLGTVTMTANYNNKSKVKFENKLELKIGFQTSRDDTIHKLKTNNDLIRYTGKFGLQATKQWYYTLQVIANTQFTQGLRSNDKYVYSDFMSPFNMNIGLGMDYSVNALKNRLRGSINLSVLSFNFKYVDREKLASRNGIKGGHQTLENFGSQLTADLNWQITDQIKWKTRLYGYTTYQRTLLEWENTFELTVSKYITANIFLHPRFDDSTRRDDDYGYFQFKEYSSLGFRYTLM